jgi:hypothetical protein
MFCGSERVELVEKISRGAEGKYKFAYYVKCHSCRARGSSFGGTGKINNSWRNFALYQWNNAPRVPLVEEG